MSTEIRKLTYQDYVCFPDDRMRHEIIDGDHYMNPAPSTYHQRVSSRLQYQLYSAIELPDFGVVMYALVDVELSECDIVQPDLVIVLKQNRIITPSKVKGTPDHVIEILSPSTASNDRTLKRTLYERVGVKEYWIVDPSDHSIEQLILDGEKYISSQATDHITVSYMDGVSVDLKQVW